MTSADPDPTPGSWGLLRFGTTATSAQVDENEEYLSGSLLRYVRIEYGRGVSLQGVTPYFSHVTLANNTGNNDGQTVGGANGPGALFCEFYRYGTSDDVLVIRDSRFISNTMGGLIVHGYARRVIIHDNNFTNNGGQAMHIEQSTEITSVRRNALINNNSCIAIGIASASTVIEGNRFVNCQNPARSYGVGVDISGGNPVIRYNLFSNNGTSSFLSDYSVVHSGAPTVISNTFIGNSVGSLIQVDDASSTYNWNNLVNNWSVYDLRRNPAIQEDVDARHNFWGTTDEAYIQERIFDYYDDFEPGKVLFSPVLPGPYVDAPGFVWRTVLSETSPIGLGLFTLSLDFSKPMSTNVAPTVTFGISPTCDAYIIAGDWVSPTSWLGHYEVTHYTGDGEQKLCVRGAIGVDDRMEIPEDRYFSFEIATIGATSISAEPGYGRVALSWNPSDLDTVAGYNLYRATTSGGPYTRLNDTVLMTFSYTDTNVTNGATYYYIVKLLTTDLCEMDYGSEAAATPNDYTAPTTPVVTDDGTCTPFTNQLHAMWSASDPDSGISEYQYSIGTWVGGTDVINWTSVGTSTEITRTGLSLTQGVTYYFNVRAKNGVGTWSNVGSSDGILISADCPIVDFTATPRSGYSPLIVQFTDLSTGSIVSRLWKFGDGATSTLTNPIHIYETQGVFTVTLAVTGSILNNTHIKPSYITVDSLSAPTATFTADIVSGTTPLTVTFNAVTTGVVEDWHWGFGDGGIAITGPVVSHTYTTPGVFDVSLTVSNTSGSYTVSEPDYITGTEPSIPAPEVDFTGTPRSGDAPLEVQFTSIVTGEVTSYAWAFGDGGIATTANPTHTYTSAGSFSVSLVVTGPGGTAQAVNPAYITVNPLPGAPTATFSANVVSGTVPLAVTFTAVTSGTVEGWHWSFGDSTVAFTGPVVQHTYQIPSVFDVSLTVSNTHGSYTVNKPRYITVSAVEHRVYLPLVLRN